MCEGRSQCVTRVRERSPPHAHPRAQAARPPSTRAGIYTDISAWDGRGAGGAVGVARSPAQSLLASFLTREFHDPPPPHLLPQSPATPSPYSKNLPRSIRARLDAAERRAAAARVAADAAPPPPSPDAYSDLPTTHHATASRRGGGRSALGPWPGTQFETPAGEVEAAQRAARAAARAADAAAVADRAAASAVAAAVPPSKMPQERRVARELRASRMLQQPASR